MLVPVVVLVPNCFISGSCRSSISSRSSRISRLKESRLKVHLAQLALRHLEEMQEEEEFGRKKADRRNEEAERRRKARHEKQRQLELANAELIAWEARSAELLPKVVTATPHKLVGESTAHSTRDAPAAFDPRCQRMKKAFSVRSAFGSIQPHQPPAIPHSEVGKNVSATPHNFVETSTAHLIHDGKTVCDLRSQRMKKVLGDLNALGGWQHYQPAISFHILK